MNAKQRRTEHRKQITRAKALGVDVPRWSGKYRIEQLIREATNRKAKERTL